MITSVFIILLMLLLSAFFSGMEIAFTSKNRLKLEIDRKQSRLFNFIADIFGIPAAEQDRVFERFYRVDKSHSKASGGTGLGLSIVKHAVQYHHGRIELESTPGTGTTIRVVFPNP